MVYTFFTVRRKNVTSTIKVKVKSATLFHFRVIKSSVNKKKEITLHKKIGIQQRVLQGVFSSKRVSV